MSELTSKDLDLWPCVAEHGFFLESCDHCRLLEIERLQQQCDAEALISTSRRDEIERLQGLLDEAHDKMEDIALSASSNEPATALCAICDHIEELHTHRGVTASHAFVPKPASSQPPISDAARDVLAERARHQSVEGWTPEHDDEHKDGELSAAAACYAVADRLPSERRYLLWPWDEQWWKPKARRVDLVRAGALILAEIERLDRRLGDG